MKSLIDKVSRNETGFNSSIIKIYALAVVGVISFFLFGFFLKLFIFEGAVNSFLFLIIAATGFLIIFLLQVFFIKTLWIANLIILVGTVGLFISFYDKISSILLITILAVFLILLWANYSGNRELKNIIKIRFFRISKIVLPRVIIGLALFISVVYYINISQAEEFFISKSSFEKIIAPVGTLVQGLNIIPNFDFSLSIEELARNIAQKQINESPQFRILSQATKEQLVNETAKETRKRIFEFLGVSAMVKPDSALSEVLYGAMAEKFLNLSQNTKNVILAIMAILLFLTIKIIAIPVRFIISILAWLIYEILLSSGFARVALEKKGKEMLILE